MSNIIIIGSGPAGISSALYTARAGIDTTVISMGSGALSKAEKIENYYGFSAPISGPALENSGIEGAKRLGVKFIKGEAVGLTFQDKLTLITNVGRYSADAVIIATGSSRKSPEIYGIKELEGKGVSYCAVCDAFFYRGRDVAVIGNGEYALHEALELAPVAKSVTIVTNGLDMNVKVPPEIKVNQKPIIKIISDNEHVSGISFSDGSTIAVHGVFVALGIAGSAALAKKIGAMTENNKIKTDEKMATNVPGLYAAGDCTGGLLQISKAVYEGSIAGIEAAKYIRSLSSKKSAFILSSK